MNYYNYVLTKELNLDPEEVLRQRIAKIQEQFENKLI